MAEAGSVGEALAALQNHPDWVLLDLMLPDGCGTEVIRSLRTGGAKSRVCIVSGCGPDKLEQAQALGPHAVFTKPLDVDRLLSLLGAPAA